MKKILIVKLIVCYCFISFFACSDNNNAKKEVFIFYYFEGYSGERGGLFAAYSRDLKTWHKLADSLITPAIG